MIVIGTFIGIVIGAIPGLGAAIGIAVMLPFTYTMTPLGAIVLLAGIFMGCGVGGSFSGILLNIPGTNEAICTTIEGYPMALRGEGKRALYLASISSTFGGIVGCIVMILFAPTLARIALKFGPGEMAVTAIIGLTIIASLSAGNLAKGILGALVGMLIATIGIDSVSGVTRFTFGQASLTMGFKQVAIALGLIAGRQIILEIKKSFMERHGDLSDRNGTTKIELEDVSALEVTKEVFGKKNIFTLLKSTIIGNVIGILPGAGCAIAAFVSYGEAKRTSKIPFGTGVSKGIIATEAANNAAVGGTFVPMLSLGIPGSNSCALIFSALTVHGIVAGPTLFTDHADLCYGFMYGLLLSSVVMGVLCFILTPAFSKIVKVKMKYIIPPVVCCIMLGSFAIRNNMFDVIVTLIFCAVGYLFHIVNIPVAPMFLGFILLPIIEKNLLLANTIAGAKSMGLVRFLFSSPICWAIMVIGVILLLLNIMAIKNQKKTKKSI